MTADEFGERLTRIETRLARLEARLGTPSTAPVPSVSPFLAQAPKPAPATKPAPVSVQAEGHPSLVTSILGWGGAIALVLAASYLIRLAIDTGWLTPMRQIAFAVVGGLLLIGVGFVLRESERHYASLPAAAGLVILFLSVYGAHLYYGLIGPEAAAAAVVALSAGSLLLSRLFASDLYTLFAVVGSYAAPFLLSGLRGSIIDVAVYFSAWASCSACSPFGMAAGSSTCSRSTSR